MKMRLSLFFMVLTCLVSAASQAVPLSDYDHALAGVQAALTDQVEALRVGQIPSGEAPLLVAQHLLGPIRSVESPGGLPQTVDADRLIDSVRIADALHGADKKVA